MARSDRYPQKTYELKIGLRAPRAGCTDLKERLGTWLREQGVDAFVEGSVDNVDVDNEPGGPERDFYNELGGAAQPLSVFKYSREALEDLQFHAEREFGTEIDLQILSMDTQVWMEGWKDSFKPITTQRFHIFPPWEGGPQPKGRLAIEIEPGMAFGTGQHVTTQLCLAGLEGLNSEHGGDFSKWSVLDVGTGTGILAIAAYKLGPKNVRGTDIDPDALMAARANAAANQIDAIDFEMGSVPTGTRADLVMANILTWVLKRLMSELAGAVVSKQWMLLSGILVADADDLISCAGQHQMQLSRRIEKDGWAALLFRKMV